MKLPLDGLVCNLGGANDRLLFFSHPRQPEVNVYTADHSILDDPHLSTLPELAVQGRQVKTKKRVALSVLLGVVFALVAGLVVLVLSKDRLVNMAASGIPVSWEVKLGDELYDQIIKGEKTVEDSGLSNQLHVITAILLEGITDNRYPLKFHIVENPTLNAFAMPGGNVVLHSGLLLEADSPEEVAGVLAHEIAHVTHRHSIRNVISSAGLYVVLSAIIGDASSLLAVIANNSAFLINRKFSRDFEREADNVGWSYLVKSGINPKGMIDFFEKMQKEEDELLKDTPAEGANQVLSIVSTHPATHERMENLERKWKDLRKNSGFKSFKLNYANFKDSLRAKLHSTDRQKEN